MRSQPDFHSLVSVHQPDAAWYALRRTLPPWRFRENFDELIRLLPAYRVNELIVKIDTEEFWHGQPRLEHIKTLQPLLIELKVAMEKLGIRYSLNPWVTLGHADRGRDDRAGFPGFQPLVGHDGTECKACACPLGSVWRKNTIEAWTLYAETQPHVLWIEDDIRTFNHDPVRYSCFCPLHLERFSAKAGVIVTREALINAILQPGEPHPWRQIYLEMQAEIMIQTCRDLAQTVYGVSPETSIGLMSSGPRNHCLEGRNWNELAKAISETSPLYSRPPLANYYETNLRGLYYAQDSIKITRYCLPANTIEHTEVENIPFSRFSKSAIFTFLQMAVSFAYGSHGASMNLFDHSGTPMADEPAYGEMLGKRKDYFNALASRAQQPGTFQGVQLLHHDRASILKRLVSKQNNYPRLEEDGYEIMEMLESSGIPTTYAPSPVVAASGQQLRAFSDEEIRELLGRGLLLDGRAAQVLCERGFGEEIGLNGKLCDPVSIDQLGTIAAEAVHHPAYGGGKYRYLTIPPFRKRPDCFKASLNDRATVISSLVDPDTHFVLPLSYAFENCLGGRVVVYLMDLETIYGPGFNHPHRQAQWQSAIRWLSRDRFPILAQSVYPLVFRKDFGGSSLVGLFNLTLDPVHEATIECSDSRLIRRIERLCGAQWIEDSSVCLSRDGETIKLCFLEDLPFSEPLFLTIYWDENPQ